MNKLNYDEKKIKKNYGEKMWQLCRKLFPTILTEETTLSNILENHFAYNHSLYEDIILQEKLYEFKNLIISDYKKKEKFIETNLTAKELLKQSGYNLYICHNEKDIQKFKKYYAKGEELCTFKTNRINDCYVFFAVKQNVSEIKRKNFPNPNRQDEYGTSVISIQFTKDGCFTLSIKNRYNDSVKDGDATFSNNLDNIKEGLTMAFYKDYGLIQRHNNIEFSMENYTLAPDGKYYKYNYKINDIYYCPNNVIITSHQIKKLNPQEYLLIDYFILDLRTKLDQDKNIIKLYDDLIPDSFPTTIKNISKIKIESINLGKKIIITTQNTEKIIIQIDERNRITALSNNYLTLIEDNFLYRNNTLEVINLENLKQVGNNFLKFNQSLKEVTLPNLKIAGDNFIFYNTIMTKAIFPKLITGGDNFLYSSVNLTQIDLSNLENIGISCLFFNKKLKKIYLPKLKEKEVTFLATNKILSRRIKRNLR